MWSGPLFEIPFVSLSKGLALECRHLEGADGPTQRLARCSEDLERACNSSKSRNGGNFDVVGTEWMYEARSGE
jgi:hypothetical protein